MTSEKRVQKFHTDDLSLPWSRWCFWLVEADFPRCMTNQKHWLDLESETSSVWNLCALSSDIISQGNQPWRREIRLFSQAVEEPRVVVFWAYVGFCFLSRQKNFQNWFLQEKKILFRRVSISLELCKLCEICRRNHTSFVKVPHRTLCVFSQSKSKCGLVGNIHGGHHANCKTLGIPE